MLELDHIVVAATDLEAGVAAVSEALGLPMAPGGKHGLMGTHNRLLSLGPDLYLEVIAIDPDAPPPGRARWFDLDRFDGPPRPWRWAARCDDLEGALAVAPAGSGVPLSVNRGDLSWRMAVTDDGRAPFGGLAPALLQWEGAAHPAPRLPDHGARLQGLSLLSPDAEALAGALAPLLSDPRITVEAALEPAITVRIATQSGSVTL